MEIRGNCLAVLLKKGYNHHFLYLVNASMK